MSLFPSNQMRLQLIVVRQYIQNLLDSLRVNVEAYVPLKNPYRYEGTLGAWDHESLRRSFVGPGVNEVSIRIIR